jgi:rRNA maturation protein Nop10
MGDPEDAGAGALPPAPVYEDSFIPAGWDGRKCLIICQQPKIVYGWKGPICPHCGGKTHRHDLPGPRPWQARDAGEHLAAVIWRALISPFRRDQEPEEVDFCEHCTDTIGPVCDDKGCLWDIFQATKEAVSEEEESNA